MSNAQLHQKLLEARDRMSFVKTKSDKLNYATLAADETLEMVGDALAAVGVAFTVSQIEATVTFHERVKMYKGNAEPQYFQHALVKLELTFTDTETGESLVLHTFGSAMDFGDKALGKAQTYGIKYAFARNFLKGEGGVDDEQDMSQNSTPQPAQTPRGEWSLERVRDLLTWANGVWADNGHETASGAHGYNRLALCAEVRTPGGSPEQLVNILNSEGVTAEFMRDSVFMYGAQTEGE